MKTDKKSNRATQTLFRTLSKNNYVLEEMIDRKANIIITTNALIISILLGSSLCQSFATDIPRLYLLVLLAIWVTSIMLALFAIKPFLITPRNLKWKEHNLLTYHTVKHSGIDEFKLKMADTIINESKVYESMTEDIYQVGKNIKRKHFFLDLAAYTFIAGIISSACIFGIIIY